MKKALAYCRVSTDLQSTSMQKNDLNNYCAEKNLDPIFFEDIYTGTKSWRPNLQGLIEEAKSGNYDAVVFWSIDRLARNTRDFLNLQFLLEELGLELIFIKDSYGNTPMGILMTQIKASIAQMEAEVIRQRVISGMAAAKARGVHCGRPVRHKLDISHIRLQLNQGRSVNEVAKEHGLSRSQLYRRLAG